MSRAAEWCWILVALLFVHLTYASSQPAHPREGVGGEGRIYHDIARDMPRVLPPQGVAPYVYRFGMPLAAAAVAKSQDWVISAGFDRVNLLFNSLSVIFLAMLLRRHVASVFARLVVIAAFMMAPHSPMRLAYFHPLSIDSATVAFLLAGLWAIEWYQSKPAPSRAWWLAALVVAGVTVHEVLLVIGVGALFAPLGSAASPRWRDRYAAIEKAGAWLPLVAGVAALWAIHAWIDATPSEYSAAFEVVRRKSPWQYAVALFLVFGPMLVVPIFFWRRTWGLLLEQPVMFACLSIFLVFAWFRDAETERMLVFASPVVWLVIARALAWSAVAPGSATVGALVLLQSLSFRVFAPIGGPIDPPESASEIWERLGSAAASWTLSDANMWSQVCAPSMLAFYLTWYAVTSAVVVALLRSGPSSIARPPVAPPRVSHAVAVVLATIAAMAPVVWLAASRFYWNHYDQPGPAYLAYNLARVWLMVVLLAAFWSTGRRLARSAAVIDSVFCGAAAWSIAVVLLAALHLYYAWVVVPLVAVAVAMALSDLMTMRRDAASHGPPPAGEWGLRAILLKLAVAVAAATLLFTIALWGNFGGDNDVPGNYLAYYESVLNAHSNGPNVYWVHFFASKGNGLGFLANLLSDVHGAALMSYLMVLLGAVLIWRVAAASTAFASTLALVAVALYLQFYAGQGAYAKSHIIRNTFVLYLILTSVRAMIAGRAGGGDDGVTRALVIAAVIVLSPLAGVILIPILLMETVLLRRSLRYAAWTMVVIAVVCAYNYFAVGLPELHSMPSAVGRFVNVNRFRAWMDPGVAYIDNRLAFVQVALQGSGSAPASTVTWFTSQGMRAVLRTMLGPPVITLLAGSMLAVLLAVIATGARAVGRLRGHAAAVVFLIVILAMAAILQMFGGGSGASIVRFTDFATAVAIALAVILIAAAMALVETTAWRRTVAGLVLLASGAAVWLGAPLIAAQHWRSSVRFFAGAETFETMHAGWDTPTARRLALSIPPHEKIELLSFLPGFSSVPSSPYQRPDGAAYLRDYTMVLYGSEDQAAGIYARYGVKYFLVDVSVGPPLLWSAFSPLFVPDSVRRRMRIVARDYSDRHDLYLLTLDDTSRTSDEEFGAFLWKWTDKRAAETRYGVYGGQYDAGRPVPRLPEKR